MIRFLAGACLFIGGAATVGAVGYAINGATQAQADIVVEASPVVAGSALSLTPLMVAPLLLALAEAFRRGTELAHDADGLV